MKMYSLAVTPNGHPEGRGSLPPPLIMRTAATPMPTPKSSPHLDPAPGLLDSRRGSSSSVDPQLSDQKSLVGTLPCPGLRAPPSPASPWSLPRRSVGPHTHTLVTLYKSLSPSGDNRSVSINGARSPCSRRRSPRRAGVGTRRADTGSRGPDLSRERQARSLSPGNARPGVGLLTGLKAKGWQAQSTRPRRKEDAVTKAGQVSRRAQATGLPADPGDA